MFFSTKVYATSRSKGRDEVEYLCKAVLWSCARASWSSLIRRLVYIPSRRSWASFFIGQVSAPQRKMLSRQAPKKASIVDFEILDCQMMWRLLQALQGCSSPCMEGRFSSSLMVTYSFLCIEKRIKLGCRILKGCWVEIVRIVKIRHMTSWLLLLDDKAFVWGQDFACSPPQLLKNLPDWELLRWTINALHM